MKAKKHILILSSWYPSSEKPFLGNFVQRQAELLSKSHQVTVLQLVGSDTESKNSVQKNDSFNEITLFYKKHTNKILNILRERKALISALRDLQEVDLIHAHVILPKGLLFLWTKKILNVPLVVTEHASYFHKTNKLSSIQRVLLRKVLKATNELIVVSECLKEDVKAITKRKSISVIPNHIDCEVFAPSEVKDHSELKFLHISTLAEIKNVKNILEAFEMFHSEHQNSNLTIVSDENSEAVLRQIENYHSKDSIHFVGPLKWHDTVSCYQTADCFILNSTYETFSIVVAEAWSCGLPVISSSVGIATDLPEFLGIQSSGTSKNDVFEAMIRFSETRKEFNSQKIREHALQFDGSVVLKQLNTVYEKI